MQDGSFSVTGLVDTAGSVVERYRYSPYGERSIMDASFTSRSSSSYGFHLGHQGLVHDAETGLVFNRSRYYHPRLGRFVSRDPAGYVDGGSLYQYLKSTPINGMDPSGLEFAPEIDIDLEPEPDIPDPEVEDALEREFDDEMEGIHDQIRELRDGDMRRDTNVGRDIGNLGRFALRAIRFFLWDLPVGIVRGIASSIYEPRFELRDLATGERIESARGMTLGYKNGINTSLEEALDMARRRYRRQLAEGQRGVLFYYPSNGVVADLVESALGVLTGWLGGTSIDRQLTAVLHDMAESGDPVDLTFYSQGTIIGSNALANFARVGGRFNPNSHVTFFGPAVSSNRAIAFSRSAGIDNSIYISHRLDAVTWVSGARGFGLNQLNGLRIQGDHQWRFHTPETYQRWFP